jgi:hypothetical protein
MRSMSKYHQEHPFSLPQLGDRSVHYEPAEAVSKIKGGNSNWRGPIWFPTTFLMIESLRKLHKAYHADLCITLEDGSTTTAGEMAEYFANALISIFTRNEKGERPVFGKVRKFQDDPHWRDYITFCEYFDGDTGKGLGASHQTGWTALVASLIDEWRT